jgi:mono/diheme cytochrome c family protein
MRRLGLILVALAFVLAVEACGGEEEATPEPETTEGTLPTEETTDTETEETTDTETEGGTGEGDPTAGKTVFASAGCGSCHTLADAGTSGTVGPDLDDAQPSHELVVDRVTNGQGAMPSFRDQLSEQQINDVAAYVSSAAGG